MKGQIFILTAAVIIMAIAALANIGFYSNLPIQREQTSLSDTNKIMLNINNELIYVIKMDPFNSSRINDFIQFCEQYAYEKNFDISFDVNTS